VLLVTVTPSHGPSHNSDHRAGVAARRGSSSHQKNLVQYNAIVVLVQ